MISHMSTAAGSYSVRGILRVWTPARGSRLRSPSSGNVYEAIYAEAKRSPLNQTPKMVGWEALSKVLDLDFLREGIGQRASL